MKLFMNLVDTILPPRCPFTGEMVESQGTVSAAAWGALSFIAAPYCDACGFPFEFEAAKGGGEALCPACLYDRPEFSAARSALFYDDHSRDFILGFKHGDRTEAVVPMIPWMRAAGADILPGVDVVAPVPLHRWRILRRRYNQAALIAAYLGKATGIEVVPDTLIRHKSTPPQGHLNVRDRAQNVKSAFAINPKREGRVKGRTILLVDDVYTTGATVRECARVLLKAGAADVRVLTLARVVRASRI